MPFKTKPADHTLAPLPGFGLIEAQGPQAGAFLQAQTMNDVAALAVGQWQWNGWLSAKGRVLALFALLRSADDAYTLVLPDAPAEPLRAALARFVFRSKLTLTVPAGRVCAAQWSDMAPAPVASRHLAQAHDDAWVVDASGDAATRGLWLLPADSPWLGAADPAASSRWREADLRHGLPRLGPAQAEQWTPQMLSLQRLRAYSLKKGCYPGQEIVARTHYLGQAKRELALVGGADLAEGAALLGIDDGAARGTIVSVADDNRLALAVVNAGTADASWLCAGTAVERLALAEGLQRTL
jgi:folate-binding protein YgfZ